MEFFRNVGLEFKYRSLSKLRHDKFEFSLPPLDARNIARNMLVSSLPVLCEVPPKRLKAYVPFDKLAKLSDQVIQKIIADVSPDGDG